MPHTDRQSAATPFLCEIRSDWDRAIVVTHGTLGAASLPRLEAAILRLCTAA